MCNCIYLRTTKYCTYPHESLAITTLMTHHIPLCSITFSHESSQLSMSHDIICHYVSSWAIKYKCTSSDETSHFLISHHIRSWATKFSQLATPYSANCIWQSKEKLPYPLCGLSKQSSVLNCLTSLNKSFELTIGKSPKFESTVQASVNVCSGYHCGWQGYLGPGQPDRECLCRPPLPAV